MAQTITTGTQIALPGRAYDSVIIQPLDGELTVLFKGISDAGASYPYEVVSTKLANGRAHNGKVVIKQGEALMVHCRGASAIIAAEVATARSCEVTLNPFVIAQSPRDLNTFGALGDSQVMSGYTTTAGNDQMNMTTGRRGATNQHNLGIWASLYSGAKLVEAGAEGLAGTTSSIILNSYLPLVARHRWKFCLISATTNDIAAGNSHTLTIDNIERMMVALLANGTIPVVLANLPNRLTRGSAYDKLNVGLRKLVNAYAREGAVYVDSWPLFVGTDGYGKSALFRDNTHLTEEGNQLLGQLIANSVMAVHPGMSDAYLPYYDAAGDGLVANPIYTQNSGAVTPTGRTISGTGIASAVASGAVGNDWTTTKGSGNAEGRTSANPAVAGKTYIFVTGIETAGGANNASSELGIRDPGFSAANHAWRWSWGARDLPVGGKIAIKVSVPTGFTDNYIRYVNAGTLNSTVKMSQTQLYETEAWT